MSPRAPRARKDLTLDLFAHEHATLRRRADLEWPAPERFPLNLDNRRSVRQVVWSDLIASSAPLVITGYASLDELIDIAAEYPRERGRLRVLLGSEPFASRRDEYRLSGESFQHEVEEYWLARGISLLRSARLIAFIDGLRAGHIEARYLSDAGGRLHAKIYCGDAAATLGSSNFTRPGLDRQIESNARFRRSVESARFAELHKIAENYWSLGHDYADALIALLQRLLKLVSWREALARACAELLEGDWAQAYLEQELPGASKLWPSQRQGIAQALYILARQGSVLIADATGSGKTRMGSHLLRAVTDQLLRTGRMRHATSQMVCPPAVGESWKNEAQLAWALLEVSSHGVLSRRGSQGHDRLVEALRRSQVLCVDEGHNFLNLHSQRTRHLLNNMADHVLVFTATPINRTVLDLLRIADLLGADNLEPTTLEMFDRMLGKSRLDRGLTDEELNRLRGEIKRFTLRRTKKMLNGLINREPGAYLDARGNPCRFPSHRPKVYLLREPEQDRELAGQIGELADRLVGITHFQKPMELPEVLRRQGWSDEKYLTSRLLSARKLARYVVMASLRSSRAALIEHIEGTARAKELCKLEGYNRSGTSGDMFSRLGKLAGAGVEHRLSVPLPDWLTDEHAHAQACKREQATYAAILKAVATMSEHRERTKAEKLAELIGRHELVLAFDSRPITLAVMRQHLKVLDGKVKVLVATGDPSSERNPLIQAFAPGSKTRTVIGLCSDSLSEGVNLQQASCVVHLDMPSVVRIAEQRVGRVDRMDSPHREIEAWWPEDGEEFALSTDERFIERYETVENLLGSNLPLPEGMQPNRRRVSARELIQEFEREAERAQWDGIDDAFEPVRTLISGDTALVDDATYEEYRTVAARVLSRVSLVPARSPWAFFCLAAGAAGAPRWVLLPSLSKSPITELDAVSTGLRERLDGSVKDLVMDERAEELLARFLDRLGKGERLLLSRRKQRALEELEKVLNALLVAAGKASDGATLEQLQVLQQALQPTNTARQPDWDEVAARWLDLIRPYWYEKLKGRKTKVFLLKDIRKDLIRAQDELMPALIERFRSFPVMAPPDERIKACIIGVA